MEILKFSSENLKEIIQKTTHAIKRGQVVVCPTDTVYGLICDASNEKAVEKIYKIKKRPKWKLLPIFVKDIKMAKKFAKINPQQERFLKKKWPGALTAVFEREKPAIRVPNYKFVLELIKRTGPLVETSANISGKPASTKIKEVIKQFILQQGSGQENQPDLVVDAGNLPKSKPSTVIDLTVSPPKILRK